MFLDIVKYLGLYILLLALQLLVINNININHAIGLYFQPQLMVMFLLLLPPKMSHVWMILVSFGAGILMDVFFNTMGINASVCTLVGFVRYYATRDIENEISGREEDNKIWTSKKGRPWKWTYFLSFIALYHLAFCLVESLGKNLFIVGLPSVILSSLVTFVVTITLEDLIYKPSKA